MLKNKNRILLGDALSKLKEIPNEYVDCIITSPPYWALRDYKVKGQIGNEKTIDEYISNLTNIFDECKRVLKKEGTCWVVMGDTYSGNGINRNGISGGTCSKRVHINNQYQPREKSEIPEKSLCLIPQRFGIKMLEHGWIARNIPIWHKPNCMPSSAKDRFTVDYEYIYFFTKSKKYYFKTQYEQYSIKTVPEMNQIYNGNGIKDYENNKVQNPSDVKRRIIESLAKQGGRIKRCVWKIATKPFPEAHFAVFPPELVKQCLDAGCPEQGIILDPFMGAGTVALIALQNNRDFLGIELNQDYIDIALKRIEPYLLQTRLL